MFSDEFVTVAIYVLAGVLNYVPVGVLFGVLFTFYICGCRSSCSCPNSFSITSCSFNSLLDCSFCRNFDHPWWGFCFHLETDTEIHK